MSCSAPTRETTVCGGMTEGEKKLATEGHLPARSGREWR
jgi:hypothetical protein